MFGQDASTQLTDAFQHPEQPDLVQEITDELDNQYDNDLWLLLSDTPQRNNVQSNGKHPNPETQLTFSGDPGNFENQSPYNVDIQRHGNDTNQPTAHIDMSNQCYGHELDQLLVDPAYPAVDMTPFIPTTVEMLQVSPPSTVDTTRLIQSTVGTNHFICSSVDTTDFLSFQSNKEGIYVAQRSNAEKCKEFRKRKKERRINLIKELKREESKNLSLSIKTRYLEDKVAKLRKILLNHAKKNKADLLQEYMLFMVDL